ncbi:MAG TPA: response regulator [Methanoregulaceae archaeon]|nr:response regulator [Methanoregulaceae archaeon]
MTCNQEHVGNYKLVAQKLPIMTLILIIEDNETIADSLSYFIKYLSHYDTLIANSAEIAIETLARGIRPDLILLDVKLPGMDGIDFLSKMHRITDMNGTKVIIYTGLPEARVRSALEERNIFIEHIVEKPARPSELIGLIEDTLRIPQKTNPL